MAEGGRDVYGVIAGFDERGTLRVEIDGGDRGYVSFEEISRQTNVRLENLERMVGWRMGFLVLDRREDGSYSLSGRAFEEREYNRICEDFRARTRNVYSARLVSVTCDGKLAFYRLAQGVNGALHVSQFSLCRVNSFREIDMPRQLTVAVSGVDEKGWLSLSAKPAFGDFAYSVNRLGFTEGSVAVGYVTGVMPDGAVAVMLAPNLAVLADASGRIGPGERVNVRCRRVDWDQHRVKAQLAGGLSAGRFPYEEWICPAEDMPAYVDLQEFDGRIRLIRSRQGEETAAQEEPREGAEMDFAVAASRSPFSTYQNERIVRETRRPTRVQDICFEIRMGYLGERHLKVAKAVEALRYSSAWQLRRYLYLSDGLSLSDREIKGVIDRLVKHDIAGVLRFQSDEGSLLTRILHPAVNYKAFSGHAPRDFGPREYMENDVSLLKTRLAANQLLIGLMHSGAEVEEVQTHPFLRDEADQTRLRPRHALLLNGKQRYLEAVRKGNEEDMLEKLKRYEACLNKRREEGAGVMMVLEEPEDVRDMARRVADMKLPFPVWLTDDLSCLPEPDFQEVPAAGRSFFQRLIRL